MRLAYQVALTAAGDEINNIMRFRQRGRREKKRARRSGRKGRDEGESGKTDGKRGEKEEDVISRGEEGTIGVENEEVNAAREKGQKGGHKLHL